MTTDPAAPPGAVDPDPLADVHAEPGEGDGWTLVLVRRLRQPPAAVWAALTEPAQLARWAPYTADRDLADPGPARLRMLDGGGDPGESLDGEVTRADPDRRLDHHWGDDRLSWRLEPDGPGTRLTLRHTVAGRDWLAKVAAGWHLCLAVADRLDDLHPPAPIVGAAAMDHGWQELHDAYAARLGRTSGSG